MYSVGYPHETFETFLKWLWIAIYSMCENPGKRNFWSLISCKAGLDSNRSFPTTKSRVRVPPSISYIAIAASVVGMMSSGKG